MGGISNQVQHVGEQETVELPTGQRLTGLLKTADYDFETTGLNTPRNQGIDWYGRYRHALFLQPNFGGAPPAAERKYAPGSVRNLRNCICLDWFVIVFRVPPIDKGCFRIEQAGELTTVSSDSQQNVYLPRQLGAFYAPPISDVFVRKVMDRKLLQVRNTYELNQAALGEWIRAGGADHVILAAVRWYEETARSDCPAQLLAG
jgi:hypothetical protein